MSLYELILLLFVSTLTDGIRVEPKKCSSLPPNVNHAVLKLYSHNTTKTDGGAFLHGSRIEYHCAHRNNRLLSKPDGMVTCVNGSWKGTKPNCKTSYGKVNVSLDHMLPRVKLPLGCVSLPKLFQMKVIASLPPRNGMYLDGTSLDFYCHVGHLYPSHNAIVCSEGRWKGRFPRCVVSQCDLPKKVEKGTWTVISHNSRLPLVQSGKLLEAVRIQYDCEAGKVLVGPKWRVCKSNGMWSGEDGMCVSRRNLYRVCPDIGGLEHGRVTCHDCDLASNKYIGVVLVASCNPGYVMLGGEENLRLRCIFPEGDDSRPRWSRRKPQCIAKDELETLAGGNTFGNGSLWSQDLTVVIVVSTVVMGSLLMIFTAVVACRCVRHAASGRRGRSNSPLHHHHHHPYSVSSASVTAGHRNEDCVALIVPPSYEEAIRDGGSLGPNVSMGTAGPASTMTADGVNTISMSNNSRGPGISSSRLAHVLSRSPRIRSSGESRDYRPLQTPFGSRQSRRAAAANVPMTGNHQQPMHHHGNIPASAGEADSVSRHSTQTSGSHGPAYCLSGSLETMAVSDGTSVTLRTYESQHGSNPSLISTRPQTGSLCETQQSSQSPQQQQSTNRGTGEALNLSVGCMTPTEQVLPVRTGNQAPVVTAPSCGNGSSNGNANSQGCISPGNVIGSEKEDSISSRS